MDLTKNYNVRRSTGGSNWNDLSRVAEFNPGLKYLFGGKTMPKILAKVSYTDIDGTVSVSIDGLIVHNSISENMVFKLVNHDTGEDIPSFGGNFAPENLGTFLSNEPLANVRLVCVDVDNNNKEIYAGKLTVETVGSLGFSVELVENLQSVVEGSKVVQSSSAPTDLQFQATVSGGVAPYTYDWIILNDSTSPSTLLDYGSNVLNRVLATDTCDVDDDCYATVRVTDSDNNVIEKTINFHTYNPMDVAITTAPLVNGFAQGANFSPTISVSKGVPPYTYAWDFEGVNSNVVNPTFTFTDTADMLLSVTVTDAEGNTESDSYNIPSNNVELAVSIMSPSEGEYIAPTAMFTCAADNGLLDGVPPYTYEWKFQGDTKSEESPEYIMDAQTEDPIPVTLKVTDSEGTTGTASVNIYLDVQPMTATITNPQEMNSFMPGDPIDCTAQVDGGLEPYTYEWTYNGATSNDEMAMFSAADGADMIELEVTDSLGNGIPVSTMIMIQPAMEDPMMDDPMMDDPMMDDPMI